MHASCLLALAVCGLPYTITQEIHPHGHEAEKFDFGRITTVLTTTKVYYAPNPGLDAYWVGGEWVFGSTRTTATTLETSRQRIINADRMLVCGRPCARVYRKLTGNVCVHKLDNVYDPKYTGEWQQSKTLGLIDWRLGGVMDRNYDYLRTFDSYCHFLDAQCRSKLAHGSGFAFLHMGPCLRDEDAFPNLMWANDIKNRKRQFIHKYYKMLNYEGKLRYWFVLLLVTT
ncbi:uncharacterized protein LOC133533166 [Cydia pomonella]|uniref:uncharacterized protein LOC133533166 n=1 Tax=Cydia pomonella TaxID=82600 RepID=UPI002ADE115E|nr:uncharacterized protein LOC133533166 [Cydia pomonella]XP_061728112.1 uncharacterized protein LOC133533166 [Cydia pomonella]